MGQPTVLSMACKLPYAACTQTFWDYRHGLPTCQLQVVPGLLAFFVFGVSLKPEAKLDIINMVHSATYAARNMHAHLFP